MASLAPRDPESPEDWQHAVDAANGLLTIDAARQYGLVKGGPAIDLDRCRALIRCGAAMGIRPRHGSAEEFTRQWQREAAQHVDED